MHKILFPPATKWGMLLVFQALEPLASFLSLLSLWKFFHWFDLLTFCIDADDYHHLMNGLKTQGSYDMSDS